MCNILRSLKLIFAGVVICGFPGTVAWAHSVSIPSELFVNAASRALLIDGIDSDSHVTIKAWFNTSNRAAFDFGFMNADSYVAIAGKSRAKGTHVFSSVASVDFALRDQGADGLFEAADDQIYHLFDSAGYAHQHYFAPVRFAESRESWVKHVYYQDRRPKWDLDLDRKPDAYTPSEIKRSRCDVMTPAPTTVPLPGGLILLGSGLMGLAAMGRRVAR